jgi:hypothetical protein
MIPIDRVGPETPNIPFNTIETRVAAQRYAANGLFVCAALMIPADYRTMIFR